MFSVAHGEDTLHRQLLFNLNINYIRAPPYSSVAVSHFFPSCALSMICMFHSKSRGNTEKRERMTETHRSPGRPVVQWL